MSLKEHRPSQAELYGFSHAEVASKDALGTTHKAVDQSGKAIVAVQVLDSLASEDPVLTEALQDYVSQIRKLNHTSIQRLFSFENGYQGCILVKEYIEGTRLDLYLRQKGVLDWQHGIRFIKELLHGLSFAHKAGFVHQSLAPDNIYITLGNKVKITDIGLIEILKACSYLPEDEWTRSAARMYAAPEVATEEVPVANVTSDIYSVGLIAYEMFTGISPSIHTDAAYERQDAVSSHLINPADLLNRAVPEELVKVIQKATDQDAIHRFSSAASMLEAIEKIGTTSVKTHVVYYKRTRVKNGILRRFRPATFIGIGAILALLSAGFFYLQHKQQNPFLALQKEQPPADTTAEAKAASPLALNAPPPSTPDPTPGISKPQTQQPQTRNPEPLTPNQEPQTPNPEPLTQQPQAPIPAPSFHTLLVRSNPSGASTSVNGKEMGITPFRLANINSEYIEVVLSLSGHQDLREEILLEDDLMTEAFFNLVPVNRHLVLNVLPWGNIYLDGELIAERVAGIDTLMISPEQSNLTVVHPIFGSWEKQLNQSADDDLSFTIDFRERASLSIATFDEDKQAVAGEVIVNGKKLNVVTPVTIELPFGKHAIEIRAPGFEPIQLTRTINLDNGQPEPLNLQMRKK